MRFEVEPEMVEPIIRDQIAAAVVAQLGDTTELVKSMVHLALTVKVAENGMPGQYRSENRFDFVEAIAGKAIREAATQAIRQVVDEQRPQIQKAIEAELKRAPRKTAAAILSAFIEGVEKDYRIKADFTISAPERY